MSERGDIQVDHLRREFGKFVAVDDVQLDVEPGETLLDATLRAGLSPEYQCQDGYCACCIAKLREGAVDMAVNDALSEAEVDDGWILTCQARPKTPAVTIDFDAF